MVAKKELGERQVTAVFYFGLVLAITYGMQDPSSLTRNQTSGLQWKHGVSTIGLPAANFPWFW